MKDDTVSRTAVIETIKSHFRVDNDLLEVIVYEVAHLPAVQTCDDAVSRQQAIDAVLRSEALVRAYGYRYAADAVRELPAVQPQAEEDCDTCKHGFFGARQCDNCRVRYPSHYEREEEQHA